MLLEEICRIHQEPTKKNTQSLQWWNDKPLKGDCIYIVLSKSNMCVEFLVCLFTLITILYLISNYIDMDINIEAAQCTQLLFVCFVLEGMAGEMIHILIQWFSTSLLYLRLHFFWNGANEDKWSKITQIVVDQIKGRTVINGHNLTLGGSSMLQVQQLCLLIIIYPPW